MLCMYILPGNHQEWELTCLPLNFSTPLEFVLECPLCILTPRKRTRLHFHSLCPLRPPISPPIPNLKRLILDILSLWKIAVYLLHWKKDEKSKELYGFEKVDTSKSESVKLVKNIQINFWSTTPIPSILGTIFYQCELMMEIFPPILRLTISEGVWYEKKLT